MQQLPHRCLLGHGSWRAVWHRFVEGAARRLRGRIKKFGGLDFCFVNANVAEWGDQFWSEGLDPEGLLKEPEPRVIDIDLHAANDTVKLALYYKRKPRPNQKKGGSIVLTTSFAGYPASAGAPLYTAKHGTEAINPIWILLIITQASWG